MKNYKAVNNEAPNNEEMKDEEISSGKRPNRGSKFGKGGYCPPYSQICIPW